MIYMTGTDHTLAPVDIRSLFTFRKQEMEESMELLKVRLHADGIVILSTCNRMEIYVSGETEADLYGELCRAKELRATSYRPFFRDRSGEEAVRHLFALTAGLKSAILAEDQILTQVKDALAFSRAHYAADNVLEVLFRKAVSAAKKVKTCVSFTHANASAISQAADLLEEQGMSLEGCTCMVIGNGEYGRLAAETLKSRGADVTVTVRQYHSGVVLIPEGCRTILYGDKMDFFPRCDLVVSATASPNYTLFYDKVAEVKPDHPMTLIDFAVPPDIDPRIGELPGYTLYNIDDFRSEETDENAAAKEQAVEILRTYLEEFRNWIHYRDLVPFIGEIAGTGAEDVSARIGRTLRKMEATEADKEELLRHVKDASEKVIARILYTLRDSLPEETFRSCIWAAENDYVGRFEEAGREK